MAPRSQRTGARPSQAGPSRRITRTRTNRDDSDEEAEAVARQVVGDADAAQDIKPFDPATWTNRAVDPGSERQVKSFLAGWSMPSGDAEEKATNLLADTARALEEAGGDDELAAQLEASIRKIIDAQHLIRAHTTTLDDLRQKLLRKEKLSDIAEKYTDGVTSSNQAYQQKTTRQKYIKEDSYFKFREGVWQGQNGDNDAMPPDFIRKALEHENGDDGESSDDEIAIGGQTQLLKCPLTLRYLTACLTSKKCKHSYSRDAILQYLDGGQDSCPATGCDQRVTREDLEENRQLEKMAKRAQQREREADQGLDDEPVEDVDDSMVL
ncbi:hypothetical protein CALVIDRAFT_601300 [Calocera viscosa TUFC12733]|uniref:SP-RING-type domain-containing protein n=1 Tax=Calocera viscosa (strain TUFC12733) TaxID=1330018 RepID=A0A167IHL2_CALVF|nr:hypothetical protein CALVIDRAFT_601300 [Calocera viscosa TUFC12733]